MPRRTVPLSDIQVSKAKSREKQYKMFDGRGLLLIVTPKGGKWWRFQYTPPIYKKPKGYGFSPWPFCFFVFRTKIFLATLLGHSSCSQREFYRVHRQARIIPVAGQNQTAGLAKVG